jgi:hypothetical protein
MVTSCSSTGTTTRGMVLDACQCFAGLQWLQRAVQTGNSCLPCAVHAYMLYSRSV